MSTRRPTLWPREHGAYVQLAAPLIVAIVVAPGWPGVAIATAACAAFLAFEPARVLAGLRGARRQTHDAPRARRRLIVLAAIATTAGAIGVSVAPATAPALAVVLAPAALAVALAWRRAVQNVAGEILVAGALSGASVPVAIAGGATWADAATSWLAWSLGFATTVVAVHHVLDRQRPAWRVALRWAVLGAIGAGSLVLAPLELRTVAIAPLATASLAVLAWSPRATRVRTIGVTFVIASAAAMAWLIGVAYRSAP